MIDATLNVLDIRVLPVEDKTHLRMVQILGLLIPLGDQSQVAQIPGAQLQTPIGKEQAIKLGNALIEAAQVLEDPKPQVDIATSMADAARMAAQEAQVQKMREGR